VFAFELLEIASSAPLSHGKMMFWYGFGVLPVKKWGKSLAPNTRIVPTAARNRFTVAAYLSMWPMH